MRLALQRPPPPPHQSPKHKGGYVTFSRETEPVGGLPQIRLKDAETAHMANEISPRKPTAAVGPLNVGQLPRLVTDLGEDATRRFLEFFTAQIENKNTRIAYGHAVGRFFAWCEDQGLTLKTIEPIVVAAYVETLKQSYSKPTVKQHLAAIRMVFDWLTTGGILPKSPATSVKGPKYSVKRGKTPVLDADQARELLDSIDTSTIVGLRDKALMGLMVYSFARVGAVVAMKTEDYYQDGKRWTFRLHEKGGKLHMVPAHHNAEAYLDAYLVAAGIADDQGLPLFRTVNRKRQLTMNAMTRVDVFRMIKRRAVAAGLPASTCCHTFRATGITAYLENGGTIENAQAIANHGDPRVTKLYDRTSDEITLDEIERIQI